MPPKLKGSCTKHVADEIVAKISLGVRVLIEGHDYVVTGNTWQSITNDPPLEDYCLTAQPVSSGSLEANDTPHADEHVQSLLQKVKWTPG